MAGIRIDSGPLSATYRFADIPQDRWKALVREKRNFLATNIKYDCRCLIEFCEEANTVWETLEYTSAADMIRNGYELDPQQIELAIAWLKINEPQAAVGIVEVSKRVLIRDVRQEHPDWTQQQIADEVGVTKGYVNQVFSKASECDNSVNTPEHLNNRNDKADYRKLPPELQQAVAAKQVSLNKAAIEAGIRKKPTQAEICVKAFRKAENRLEALKLIVSELEPFEAAVVRDMAIERLN
jgi:transcriptional regulator with XRE-family HTH domain